MRTKSSRLPAYFACSITGGRELQSSYPVIVATMEKAGLNVLSKEFALPSLTAAGTQHLTPTEVHDRDMRWLTQAKVVVAEVSVVSMGLGYELGRLAERASRGQGKPVILLLKSGRRLSSMVSGSAAKGFVTITYTTQQQLVSQLRQELARINESRPVQPKVTPLYTFSFKGGGFNSVSAHSRKQALARIRKQFSSFEADPSSLKRLSTPAAINNYFQNIPPLD